MLTIAPSSAEPPRAARGDYAPAETEAMQRAIINIFDRWGVSDVDAAVILGGLSAKTFRRWKDGKYGRVDRDLADRMSLLLGIHKALRIVFADPDRGYAWMRRPNAAFAGRTALEVLGGGGMEDLIRLRRYLDAVRGGW